MATDLKHIKYVLLLIALILLVGLVLDVLPLALELWEGDKVERVVATGRKMIFYVQ